MKYREDAKNFGLSHGSITNIIKNYHKGKLRGKRREYISKHSQEVENYRTQQHINDLKLQIADMFLENLMLKKMVNLPAASGGEVHGLREGSPLFRLRLVREELSLRRLQTLIGMISDVSPDHGRSHSFSYCAHKIGVPPQFATPELSSKVAEPFKHQPGTVAL